MPFGTNAVYNQAPSSPSGTPGLTTSAPNSQTISSTSGLGTPQLGTTPTGFNPIPQYQAQTTQGFGMLGTPPPAPSMNNYLNSSNPSTLMRTMVGNTTQSGAL